MEVNEWLDQMHIYFSHQNRESDYSFVSSGVDTKMASLPCMLSFHLQKFQILFYSLKKLFVSCENLILNSSN